MKVLVVGGAGYVGGATTDALAKRGADFSVYDSLIYEHQYTKPLDFLRGDVRDQEKLKKILPRYSHVIWLAAIVGDAACRVNPQLTKAINQDSIKWLAQNYDGRIVFTSTASVYGYNPDPVDEESSPNPLSEYASTKVEAEKCLNNKNALILRLGTAFGVSDTYSRVRMDLVVNYMTANAIAKGFLPVFGGKQVRPLVHVKDIGQIIAQNIDRPIRGTYNVAATNKQIKEIAQAVGNVTGCKVEHTDQKFEDQRSYHAKTDKSMRDNLFNINELRGLEDGVTEIADLVNSERLKYNEADIHFNERHIAKLVSSGLI